MASAQSTTALNVSRELLLVAERVQNLLQSKSATHCTQNIQNTQNPTTPAHCANAQPITLPNILITGTPGVGKSTFAARLCELTGLRHVMVGDLVREQACHDGWDDEFECWILNEDKLCDVLEDTMKDGGACVDFHSCDFFPERWFQLVIVLHASNTTLYDRLVERGYKGKKLQENVESEIMRVIADEARESYDAQMVVELDNDTIEDMNKNILRTLQWLEQVLGATIRTDDAQKI